MDRVGRLRRGHCASQSKRHRTSRAEGACTSGTRGHKRLTSTNGQNVNTIYDHILAMCSLQSRLQIDDINQNESISGD